MVPLYWLSSICSERLPYQRDHVRRSSARRFGGRAAKGTSATTRCSDISARARAQPIWRMFAIPRRTSTRTRNMIRVLQQTSPAAPSLDCSRSARAIVEITQAVADPVFASAGGAWWIVHAAEFAVRPVVRRIDRMAVLQGNWHLGRQLHGGVGRRDCQLRLVDRHRQCRHADLVDAAVDAAAVARIDQSLRRGDDTVRGRDCRNHADHACRPADLRLLARALSRTRWRFGRNGAARWSGISGRSSAICCFRSCSGTSA